MCNFYIVFSKIKVHGWLSLFDKTVFDKTERVEVTKNNKCFNSSLISEKKLKKNLLSFLLPIEQRPDDHFLVKINKNTIYIFGGKLEGNFLV